MGDAGWGTGISEKRCHSGGFDFRSSFMPEYYRRVQPSNGQSYRDLRVWNTAISLVLEVYRITDSFPHAERFGLTSQVRRAAVSVPSNIAEGHSRSTRGEYKN